MVIQLASISYNLQLQQKHPYDVSVLAMSMISCDKDRQGTEAGANHAHHLLHSPVVAPKWCGVGHHNAILLVHLVGSLSYPGPSLVADRIVWPSQSINSAHTYNQGCKLVAISPILAIEIFIWRLMQQILAIVPRTVNTVHAHNNSVDIGRY